MRELFKLICFWAVIGFLLAIALGGCASKPTAPELHTEYVAVPAQCPAPEIPAKPALPIAELTADATPAQTATAYAESLRICAAYSQQLLILLKAYQ